VSNFSIIRGLALSYSGFHPPKHGVSSTNQFGVSPTKNSWKPQQCSRSENVIRARVFNIINDFNAEKQNLEGALPPLQTTLQEGKAKGMRASTHAFLFLVAVTTKEFNSKALLFKPFFLKRTSKKSVINRTLKGRGLDSQILLQRSAVMQSGGTQPLKRSVVTTLQTGNANEI